MDIELFKKNFGLRLKLFRNNNNYSQEQFCEIIDLEQPNLSNIETGKTFPNIATLYNIIFKAKVAPSFLFDFVETDQTCDNSIDYEIIEKISKLSPDSKIRLKNIIEILK